MRTWLGYKGSSVASPFLVGLLLIGTLSTSIAEEDKSETSFTLQCSSNGMPLDGSINSEALSERIKVDVKKFDGANGNDGKPRFWYVSEAKINSKNIEYKASIVSTSISHAVVAYSNLIKSGISSFVLSVLYEIDTSTLKARRTSSVFPIGSNVSQDMKCVTQR